MNGERFGVHFGALCDPIEKQLTDQGQRFEKREYAKVIQAWADSITRLLINDILSESEAHRAHKRLMKKLKRRLGGPAPEEGEGK